MLLLMYFDSDDSMNLIILMYVFKNVQFRANYHYKKREKKTLQ